jgi:ubiquinone/menaquinone biosynthesis C-methylase UbiE
MPEHDDAVRQRFAATAADVALHAREQVVLVREQVRSFVPLRGEERALDVGTGAGTLALALAPLVREVVGVDLVPELLRAARREAPANATFVEGDATALPIDDACFDLVCSRRTLHHVGRPAAAVEELARVCLAGGHAYVDDQIAPEDEDEAAALDRFERARDPSHARTLTESELRGLLEANGFRVVRAERAEHRRPLDYYLALAGCAGEAAERVKELSPGDPDHYVASSVRLACVRA